MSAPVECRHSWGTRARPHPRTHDRQRTQQVSSAERLPSACRHGERQWRRMGAAQRHHGIAIGARHRRTASHARGGSSLGCPLCETRGARLAAQRQALQLYGCGPSQHATEDIATRTPRARREPWTAAWRAAYSCALGFSSENFFRGHFSGEEARARKFGPRGG